MADTRDELREHLTAVIEAAQELPREDRRYLADNFLDELEARYQLVPHGQDPRRIRERAPHGRRAYRFVGMGVIALLVLPVLMVTFLVHGHPPIFLFGLFALFLFRFTGSGRRGGGMWRQGPTHRHSRNFTL